QWITGESKSLKPENLFALAKATGFSAMWLAIGQGEEHDRQHEIPSNVTAISSNVEGGPVPIRDGAVPVVGIAKLGAQGYFEAIDYPVGHGDGFVLISSSDENAYA